MPVINRIADFHQEMTAWRHDIHSHPETAFEEVRTAEVVAKKLESWGIEVHRGLAKTGVIGTLRAGTSGRSIGLRADMDALDVHETNKFGHASTIPGKMHACGHDGHTCMLLGAAKYLAETRNFDGTIHFIFQPAEENEGGGRVMVEEGLFDKFRCDDVYGMHNIPGIPTGRFAIRSGPMMAAYDIFEIVVKGVGAHGAMPHQGIDPVVVGSHIVTALQSIVARNVDPMGTAVVSTTQIHAGDTWNVIPQECTLRGTVRTFKKEVQDMIEARIEKIARNVAAGFGAEVIKWRYERRYPATVTARPRPRRRRAPPRRWSATATSIATRRRRWARKTSPGCCWPGRRLYLDRQRRRRRQLHGPQPRLRLQRRDPAAGRLVLGHAGRAAAGARLAAAGGGVTGAPAHPARAPSASIRPTRHPERSEGSPCYGRSLATLGMTVVANAVRRWRRRRN